jgi:hypothetical protein
VLKAIKPPSMDQFSGVFCGGLPGRRVDLDPLLALLAMHADIIDAPEISEEICENPDDDKFLPCAVAAGAFAVVSGDKRLRAVSGWQGVDVMTPRAFVERYLPKKRQGSKHSIAVLRYPASTSIRSAAIF